MTNSTLTTPVWLNLPQPILGWERFVGSWLIRGKVTVLVDVGPSVSIEHLLSSLEEAGIDRIDYVWLTHIHIDHAGGLGRFLHRYPEAKAVVPAKAVPHLIDPRRLWEGSLATLGEKALAYGPIAPVGADRLIPHNEFSLEGLTILETPGHAPYHLCFVYGEVLFSGEAAGIYLPLDDDFYLRPPTPPRFFFETTLSSVDKLLALGNRPIYFGHAGSHPESARLLNAYREQLFLWKRLIGQILEERFDTPTDTIAELLLEKDPLLKNFFRLDSLSREREMYFLKNSIAGFVGYLQSQPSLKGVQK